MAQVNRYVLFNANGIGARIYINPSKPIEGALLNPNLDKVKGISPNSWKLQNNEIISGESSFTEGSELDSYFKKEIVHVPYPVEVIKKIKVPIDVLRIKEVPVVVEKIVYKKTKLFNTLMFLVIVLQLFLTLRGLYV